MKKYVAALAAAGALLGTAHAASAHPQPIRLINHAGLTGNQVAQFTNAGRKMINNQVSWWWNTRWLRWTSSQKAWTIEFVNTLGPVESACGFGAAGCHMVRNGKPYAIVDTSWSDTHVIWSVAGTHGSRKCGSTRGAIA